MTELAEAAVLLAQRGYRVFPVGANKAPRIAGGFNAATDIPERVRGWQRKGMWEDGGIGLVIPDRVFVVDVDPRNGGAATMEALVNLHGSLPRTRLVRTGGGGAHWYFALPDDLELRGSLGPGVDIKKPGRGYVLVPPSRGYRYVVGGKPTAAPQWLLDELVVRRTAPSDASKPKFFAVMGGTSYGRAALRAELAVVRATGEGGRRAQLNTSAFKLAMLVAGGELDEDRTCAALLEAAMETGLDEQQALSRIKSGWFAGLAKPRQAE